MAENKWWRVDWEVICYTNTPVDLIAGRHITDEGRARKSRREEGPETVRILDDDPTKTYLLTGMRDHPLVALTWVVPTNQIATLPLFRQKCLYNVCFLFQTECFNVLQIMYIALYMWYLVLGWINRFLLDCLWFSIDCLPCSVLICLLAIRFPLISANINNDLCTLIILNTF